MIRVASMGAISKPDGSVRPLHDATHGVRVNNQIRLVNQVAVPGPAEMAFSVRQSGAMQEVPLAATADVSAAHRLVLHRRKDWALMACRAEQNSKHGLDQQGGDVWTQPSFVLVEPLVWDNRPRGRTLPLAARLLPLRICGRCASDLLW